jgi:hypothetical protein
MIKFIHKFFLSRKFSPVLHTIATEPEVTRRFMNVNKIADGLEKTSRLLVELRSKAVPNSDAIATWERIQANLQCQWRDAGIEISTNGHYTFE